MNPNVLERRKKSGSCIVVIKVFGSERESRSQMLKVAVSNQMP